MHRHPASGPVDLAALRVRQQPGQLVGRERVVIAVRAGQVDPLLRSNSRRRARTAAIDTSSNAPVRRKDRRPIRTRTSSRCPMSTDASPSSGACRAYAASRAGRTEGSGRAWFQNSPNAAPGRRTAAALAAPRRGSTQCQAWPAVSRSKRRSPASHSSIVPASTAHAAAAGHGRHAWVGLETEHRQHPRAVNRRAAIPVPHPTSSTVAGLPAPGACR